MTITDTGILDVAPRRAFASKIAHKLDAALSEIPAYAIVWWCFVVCLALGNLGAFVGEGAGPLYYMVAFGGSAGCAWIWLFSRTLFKLDARLTPWPIALLGATILIEGAWAVTDGLAAAGLAGETKRLISNAASYICISLLALVFVEAFNGFGKDLPRNERRFRQIFTGFFGAALVVTILWAWNAPEGSLAARSEALTHFAFGLLAIVGGRFAIEFRKKNPISRSQLNARRVSRDRPVDASAGALADRIQNILRDESFCATPKLKVSDLARAIGEPEYKVSQCITGVMGHQNFNRLVNSHRVANAKAALRDRSNDDRQILAIALDCGFNSIGPFNRAFKEEVGMTPRRYRAERL
ncbi:MAG: helix-turn-helix transcriptional regulator [Marinicaulis sp.]|nr:helix-turn-helix transcriptional regulator [Marinicaulis sp.]